MDVETTSLKEFTADMSVIKPAPTGHLSMPGSPVKAGVSTPNTSSSKPRRSPRTSSMPPPAGQPQGRKPWQSGRGSSALTPQSGPARPGKKSLKHSVSASVLPRQQGAGPQPLSFR